MGGLTRVAALRRRDGGRGGRREAAVPTSKGEFAGLETGRGPGRASAGEGFAVTARRSRRERTRAPRGLDRTVGRSRPNVENPVDLHANRREPGAQLPGWAFSAIMIPVGESAARHEPEVGDRAFEIPERLLPFVVTRSDDANPARRLRGRAALKVPRAAVFAWIGRRKLLARRSAARGWNVPAAQILGPAEVVPVLAEMAEIVGGLALAWAFAAQEWPFDDGAVAPLEMLKAGRLRGVLDAAPGFGAAFT